MMTAALIETSALRVDAPGGRPLFSELAMSVGRERVAVIGRNGSGKSTLLRTLAGWDDPARGAVVRRGAIVLVPQRLPDGAGSPGERRRRALVHAKRARPDLLLLDEPTQDLDERAVAWLCDWVEKWPNGLLVVSHDRRLLTRFEHFFVVEESGGRYVPGAYDRLEAQLEEERARRELAYVRHLRRLVQREEHNHRVRQGRIRKKNRGRVNELDRCHTRILLNANRSYAQESQGRRFGRLRESIDAARRYAEAARRALSVSLPLDLVPPVLPSAYGEPLRAGELAIAARERIGVIGPNGAGKTTLLERLVAAAPPSRTGYIPHAGSTGALDESLVERLARTSSAHTPEAAAELLVAHRFPLALAQRPLESLSPGERARAVLITCWRRDPPVELLVLDEPTESLDFTALAALRDALRSWPGTLVVASHDRTFLEDIGIERWIDIPRRRA